MTMTSASPNESSGNTSTPEKCCVLPPVTVSHIAVQTASEAARPQASRSFEPHGLGSIFVRVPLGNKYRDTVFHEGIAGVLELRQNPILDVRAEAEDRTDEFVEIGDPQLWANHVAKLGELRDLVIRHVQAAKEKERAT